MGKNGTRKRVLYFSSGLKEVEEEYQDGEKYGKETQWYENGQKQWEIVASTDGELISSKLWDKDGNQIQ